MVAALLELLEEGALLALLRNSDDIANKAASTTTQYFMDLFDIDNYGKAEWDPYVNVDLGVLSGSGVPGMTGSTLESKNIAWVVVKNLTSEVADVIPALVSRNVDFNSLNGYLAKFDGTATTKITMGGTYDQPFGNKAWVLVRKGGASQVIKAKYSRLDVIFNRQGFDNSSKEKQMSYMDL